VREIRGLLGPEQADEFFNTGRGFVLDDGDVVGDSGGIGVDVVDGYIGPHVVEQTCGGIYYERCAYDYKYVGFLCQSYGRFDIGHGFLEKYDVGPHGVTVMVACLGGGDYAVGVEGVDTFGVSERAYFH